MSEDAGIKWIRDVRHRISEEAGHDPRTFVEFHRALRQRYLRQDEAAAKVGKEHAGQRVG